MPALDEKELAEEREALDRLIQAMEEEMVSIRYRLDDIEREMFRLETEGVDR